jgi:hypothetical protein
MGNRLKITVLACLMVFFQIYSYAQCAMCRATAETAAENVDRGIGEGLNSGIVYLMGIPYLLLTIGAVAFYRKKIIAFFRD